MAAAEEGSGKDMLSLVLRSRKALDHTKALCVRAEALSKDSTELALDLVAVDAKVRWATEMIQDQLKLVNNVARALSIQRLKLEQDAKAWDQKRKERTGALDVLLDDLGSQLVPPSFYETTSGSSLFGSQHSDEERADGAVDGTTKENHVNKHNGGRTKWKSLRFFVDEKAIEEAIERMDDDRNALEDLLESTGSQTQNLNAETQAIRNSLATAQSSIPASTQKLLQDQDAILSRMAQLLLDVTHHFDQMESALADQDAGEVLGDEDMEVLEGDTAELPVIIQETEQNLTKMEEISHKLKSSRETCERDLTHQKSCLTALESLGIEMSDLVDRHQSVEVEATAIQNTLQGHLIAISTLQETYIKYRAAYGSLVQEMSRRQKYREAMEEIIQGMNEQLRAMRQEEMSHREQFSKKEGAYLPEDLCPFVSDLPTVFEISAYDEEVPVSVDSQYVIEVQQNLSGGPGRRVVQI
ncbi:autophagy protein 17 [Serendipita sp. 397]|nr:autophagy protein 17 [Serendipita sp. 397]